MTPEQIAEIEERWGVANDGWTRQGPLFALIPDLIEHIATLGAEKERLLDTITSETECRATAEANNRLLNEFIAIRESQLTRYRAVVEMAKGWLARNRDEGMRYLALEVILDEAESVDGQ